MARARAPIFHTTFAVADTIDGRFDLLTLHAFAVMEALKSSGPAQREAGYRPRKRDLCRVSMTACGSSG